MWAGVGMNSGESITMASLPLRSSTLSPRVNAAEETQGATIVTARAIFSIVELKRRWRAGAAIWSPI